MSTTVAPEPAAVVAPPAAVSTPAAAAPAAAAVTPVAAVAPVAPAVPESYPLALRDGSPLAKDALARITERAKGLGITDPKVAQAFVDAADAEAVEAFTRLQESQKVGGEAHKALVAQYEAASLAHPEVGNGDPLTMEKRSHEAGLFLAEHLPGLLPILKETGFAARWEVIAGFSKLYRSMNESPLATGRPSGAPEGVSWENQMYAPGVLSGTKAPSAL